MIDHFVIEHYSQKKKISFIESQKLHIELEMFLSEASKGGVLIPSVQIDDVWHNFILHTKKYDDYCKEKFNKFIHHNPYLISLEEKSCESNDEGTIAPPNCDSYTLEKHQLNMIANCGSDGGGSSCGSSCDSQVYAD